MKRYFSFLLLLFTIIGCSHGPIVSMAKVSPQEKAAKVFVIRKSSFYGGAVSYTITLDEKEIFFIRSGDYTTFEVIPGKHLIGVICPHPPLSQMKIREDMLDISFGPEEAHFFLVSNNTFNLDCTVKIEEISRNDGLKYVSGYKYVPMAQ